VSDGSKRAIIAAFLADLGIAIARSIGFVTTGSAGMLAEAVRSVADAIDTTDAIDTAEANIRAAAPAARRIYIEPDFERPIAAD
jgi:Co/Zn/Cd efflux system component